MSNTKKNAKKNLAIVKQAQAEITPTEQKTPITISRPLPKPITVKKGKGPWNIL